MRIRLLRSLLVSAAAPAAAALAVAGCGLGAGPGTHDATVTVTKDFGSQTVADVVQKKVPGSETVMALLQREFKVTTRYGGGYVQSIDGSSGSVNHQDWFYYVNGVQAPKGAAVTQVHAGDHIWWDLHNWTATNSIPAVVGSYPEPFTSGTGGRRYPTVLTCAQKVSRACAVVAASLHKAGVKVSYQGFGTGSGSDSLAIVVGTLDQLRGVIASDLIAAGPSKSGVYAQNVGGSAIELDDPLGDVVQTLHGDAGLVAATDQPSLNEPAWIVTGTTVAGVDEAAAAVTPAKLRGHFAVAVTGGRVVPVPILNR